MQSHQDTTVGCLHLPSIIPFTLQPHDITLRDETLRGSMEYGEWRASSCWRPWPSCMTWHIKCVSILKHKKSLNQTETLTLNNTSRLDESVESNMIRVTKAWTVVSHVPSPGITVDHIWSLSLMALTDSGSMFPWWFLPSRQPHSHTVKFSKQLKIGAVGASVIGLNDWTEQGSLLWLQGCSRGKRVLAWRGSRGKREAVVIMENGCHGRPRRACFCSPGQLMSPRWTASCFGFLSLRR